MKRHKTDLNASFGPVKLYREDIDEVLAMFRNACEQVTISDDEYEYESLEEVQARRGSRPLNLTIWGHRPYMALQLGVERVGRFLRSDKNSLYGAPEGELLGYKFRDYVKAKQRTLRWLFPSWLFLLAIVVDMGHVFLGVDQWLNRRGNLAYDSFHLVFAGYVWTFLFFYWRGLSYLSLEPRHSTSFVGKHGYDLFKGIVLTAFGFFLKWLLDHFSK